MSPAGRPWYQSPMSTSFAGPVAAAEHLAAELLGDLRTALGGLQIAHARRVAAAVRGSGDDVLVAAALLHDVVEKGCIGVGDLDRLVPDRRVTDLVRILTHDHGESVRAYLERCGASPAAMVIKQADLADKLTTDDVDVAPSAARAVRRRATARLALLDELAVPVPAAS